jgi:hypothetical protein
VVAARSQSCRQIYMVVEYGEEGATDIGCGKGEGARCACDDNFQSYAK